MIKLTKINRTKSYYTYGGEPVDETPSFELEYNYKKVEFSSINLYNTMLIVSYICLLYN